MSNCVSINGLENLPAEETLLVYYNITCTGEWHLSQLLTAYRSVCDSEWTVMYPNHQHPQHTDFPISVAQAGQSATFAWNYGGIYGIQAENFDSQHSYLIQLCLFEYNCFNTGENTGERDPFPTGENTGTGTTGGGGGGGGGGDDEDPIPPPGGPDPVPALIFEPLPPWEDPGDPEGYPGGGSTGTGNYVFLGFISDPPILDPPTFSISISNIGLQNHVISSISNETAYNPVINSLFVRPSGNTPGGNLNPNILFTPLASSKSVPFTLDKHNNLQDLNNITTANEGSIIGKVSSSLIGSPLLGNSISKQLNTKSLDSNAYIQMQVLNSEVTIGEPIIISCFFRPSTDMKARGTLTIQDESKSIDIVTTDFINITPTLPLTAGASSRSDLYNLGALVATFHVFNSDNNLIGVKSILINNLGVNNRGDYQSSKTTISDNLPTSIVNYSYPPIGGERYILDLFYRQSKYILLESATAQTSISVVLQTDNDTNNNMSLSIYMPTGVDKTYFGEGEFLSNASGYQGDIQSTPIIKTDSKFRIEGLEVYPHTHNVGISNAALDSTYVVVLGISKAMYSNSFSSKGYLSISNNFKLKEPVATGYADYIKGSLPYIGERYGLILHGKTPGVIPADYTVIETTTTNLGAFIFSGISWSEGDHYSIIETKQGILNLFAPPVYTGTYTL